MPRPYADVTTLADLIRQHQLLSTRLANERATLVNWQRRLSLRTDYERTHPEERTQLPQIRQECAATHALVEEIERRVIQTRRQVVQLSAPRKETP